MHEQLLNEARAWADDDLLPPDAANIIRDLIAAVEAEQWRVIDDAARKCGQSFIMGHGDGVAIKDCTYVMVWRNDRWEDAYSGDPLAPTHYKPITVPK